LIFNSKEGGFEGMKKGVDIHKHGMVVEKKRGRLEELGRDKKAVRRLLQ
jgi:hypothetical protein